MKAKEIVNNLTTEKTTDNQIETWREMTESNG